MILTYNYQDLQNIKEQMKKVKIKDEEKIYFFINSYKDTLSFMYKNKLVRNVTKGEIEKEIEDFASDMLHNTKKTYNELENLYKSRMNKRNIRNPKDIKLKK